MSLDRDYSVMERANSIANCQLSTSDLQSQSQSEIENRLLAIASSRTLRAELEVLVYVTRFRVIAMLKKEVRRLEKG